MKISKLEPSARKKGRWLLRLDNDELLRVGEREMIDFALYAGMELEDEVLEALRASAKRSGFQDYALNLLSTRPLSCRELTQKLEGKDCPPEQAAAIAERLCELGYLDDRAYAFTVVRHYAEKGYGPYKIRDELYRRGVPKIYWEEALADRADAADSIDSFVRRKLRGVEAPDRRDWKRISDALARRGYSWSDISAALRRYNAADTEDMI